MEHYYTPNRNVQMLICLLKAHNIRKVIVSPGVGIIPFVGSIQQDPYFELYSAIDERGAAYMATGLAYESGEPVVITCTGATASRNYMPGLTEAFYRKLPILAVTGAQYDSNAGNLSPQYVDRNAVPNDLVKLSVSVQDIKDEKDEWDCNLKINRALLELRRNGGGPVHINLSTGLIKKFDVRELPETRVIRRFYAEDAFPEIPENTKIAISACSMRPWSEQLVSAAERFCEENNAVILVDHTSGYRGKYSVLPTLDACQEQMESVFFDIDLLIHIGEHTGDVYTHAKFSKVKEVWRVNEDGELRDPYCRLTNVFEMSPETFFKKCIKNTQKVKMTYLAEWKSELKELYNTIVELPFSNIWMTKKVAPYIPDNSYIHFGVSNTLRSWTFFELPENVITTANVGVRGIDGALSTALGMSLANKDKLHFCFLGDLTFFYNMNALGNRQVGNNLRILLVNNGIGAEFRLYQHIGYQTLNENVRDFVAAEGHNGNKSPLLVKKYVESLGFRYMCASSKEEFEKVMPEFLDEKVGDAPILVEIFTNPEDESDALRIIRNLRKSDDTIRRDKIKSILGEKGTKFVKSVLGK